MYVWNKLGMWIYFSNHIFGSCFRAVLVCWFLSQEHSCLSSQCSPWPFLYTSLLKCVFQSTHFFFGAVRFVSPFCAFKILVFMLFFFFFSLSLSHPAHLFISACCSFIWSAGLLSQHISCCEFPLLFYRSCNLHPEDSWNCFYV